MTMISNAQSLRKACFDFYEFPTTQRVDGKNLVIIINVWRFYINVNSAVGKVLTYKKNIIT